MGGGGEAEMESFAIWTGGEQGSARGCGSLLQTLFAERAGEQSGCCQPPNDFRILRILRGRVRGGSGQLGRCNYLAGGDFSGIILR